MPAKGPPAMTDPKSRYKAQAREFRAYLRKVAAIQMRHATRPRNVDPAESSEELRRDMSRIRPVPQPDGYSPPPNDCMRRNIYTRKDRARRIREIRSAIIRRADDLIFDWTHGYDFKVQYTKSTTELAKELRKLIKGR